MEYMYGTYLYEIFGLEFMLGIPFVYVWVKITLTLQYMCILVGLGPF